MVNFCLLVLASSKFFFEVVHWGALPCRKKVLGLIVVIINVHGLTFGTLNDIWYLSLISLKGIFQDLFTELNYLFEESGKVIELDNINEVILAIPCLIINRRNY